MKLINEIKPPSEDMDFKMILFLLTLICAFIFIKSHLKFNDKSPSFIKGHIIGVSSIFGKKYADVKIDCQRQNCGQERYYFTNDIEREVLYAFRTNTKLMLKYNDGILFNQIETVDFEY